ncbi:Adenine phosphoribosyltransferase [Frankliniella fusca]|uniref:Adenine phosphoribosyltransferase n=1 Tax=Frankliniella fusca TaxID=407009 RepID=A0AAE1GZP9_9NEOP|nr:Adenine phosphoribosyltransferase [Frankliniella fusca]
MGSLSDLEIVKAHIASYPDFPKLGILFRDMFPIFQSPEALAALENLLVSHVKSLQGVDVVVALESRGFLLAPLISSKLGIPMVPIRKKGKLPGKTRKVDFILEYGTDTFEMQENSIKPGQKVVIVDDLLATGGTAKAACQLIKDMNGEVIELLVLMELKDLKGRNNVPCSVHSLVQF